MQYTALLLAALATITAAAPVLSPRATLWTPNAFTRTCFSTNTCTYSYAINTNDGTTPTPCNYTVAGVGTTPASQQSYQTQCGAFAIGSTWSGQFGPGKGFQTLSFVRNG